MCSALLHLSLEIETKRVLGENLLYYFYCSTPLYEILMMLSRFEAPLYIPASTSNNVLRSSSSSFGCQQRQPLLLTFALKRVFPFLPQSKDGKYRQRFLYQQQSTVMLMHTGYNVFDQTIFVCYRTPFQLSFSSYLQHLLSKIDFQELFVLFLKFWVISLYNEPKFILRRRYYLDSHLLNTMV